MIKLRLQLNEGFSGDSWNLPAMWGPWVQSLSQEDSLEKEMATHSSILPWEIPWQVTVQGVAKESDTS